MKIETSSSQFILFCILKDILLSKLPYSKSSEQKNIPLIVFKNECSQSGLCIDRLRFSPISIWNLQLQPYQGRPSKRTQYLWQHPIKRANTSTCLPEKTCATTAQKPRNTKISIYRHLQRRAQSSNQDERMSEHISQGVLTGFSAVVSSYPLTCSVRTFSSKGIQNTWHRNLGHINPRATV